MTSKPILGVIGGSGLYAMTGLSETKSIEINTPFGRPSAPIVIGQMVGQPVAFLARHGIGHHIPPSEVNYRANIYALKSIGVERVISISACGALREDYSPGSIVIPDQIFDFTHLRQRSFFGDGLVVHAGTADPICAELSALAALAVSAAGAQVHKGGTFITIEGPRFSTKAESALFRNWGMSIIGMTACPEVFLAREAEMSYAIMAHVTDYDVWHVNEQPVSVDMVIRTLMQNTVVAQKAIELLVGSLVNLPAPNCACSHALADAIITQRDRIAPETRQRCDLLVKKYLE